MGHGLTTFDEYNLNLACQPLRAWCDSFDEPCGVYLVGSVYERRDFRDVDVRMILDDPVFDRIFGCDEHLWSLFSYAWTCQLRAQTGLLIDFQVQRRTEANEQHKGRRSSLGLNHPRKFIFAAGGDATRFRPAEGSAEEAGGE